MVESLESNALYRQYVKEKSLLELYGHVSSLTYEEWLEAKRQNNVKESINYWMSRCASLQQEVDVLNEKLANECIIHWQTGKPKEEGFYLVTFRFLNNHGKNGITKAEWYNKHWYIGLNYPQEEILAWCPLSDIEPYKEETK